mmetsp:Transcript_154/g.394  ORF Transcript_154/g.394 Transcript_154/m.394 type:complete len:409 (-) Transcript_154:246-1472(-)|eukprot:CAMPEP_0114525428 /NCGR_PEP_ID=MMETSP0109-20121206/22414_1 /TAXON_ID=29199 /ORGANISM="Chlorarachnion reptans, Strain CCCM449" /LENGTH=408 /DNA_ID=CAMNT_0001706999 /DNA_START=845 /DNA_END=2071 /DNA_ORIENTATION=+
MQSRSAWESSVGSCNYTQRARVIQDVREVLYQTRSLQARVEAYVFNDGKMANLVGLTGTIPIHYRRNQYNIPVKIWVTQDYPRSAPIAYVTPTKDMRIHRGHPNVDESGTVYMSYPIWTENRSTLAMLCVILSQKFSQKPPVYKATSMTRPVRKAAPVSVNNPIQRARPVFQNSGVSPPVARPVAQPVRPQGYNPQWQNGSVQPQNQQNQGMAHLYQVSNPYGNQGASQAMSIEVDPRAKRKEELLSKARKMLKERAEELLGEQKEEIGRLGEAEQKLSQGKLQLSRVQAETLHEKQQLQQSLKTLNNQEVELTKWLGEREGKELVIDEVVDGKDTWSKQVLNEVAKDNAIEDTLYALDKALENGQINLDVFLRQVRRLSKQQFQHRMLALKIMERQEQKSAMLDMHT